MRKSTPILKSDLIELYINQQLSYAKVAEKLGASDEGVRKAMVRLGIPRRSKKEAQKLREFTPEHKEKLRQRLSQYNKGLFGSDHPAWKGGRQINSYGYVVLRKPGKYVYEHRWLMEQHLGRKLEPWEEINHINGIKIDNRLENLEVIHSEHKYRDWHRRNGGIVRA